jgi:hypothetical protein
MPILGNRYQGPIKPRNNDRVQALKDAAAPLVPATNATRPNVDPETGARSGPRNGNPAGNAPPPSGASGIPTQTTATISHMDQGVTNSLANNPIANQATGKPPSNEDLYNEAMRKLLAGGPRDTSEEERLLREQMQRDVGSGQANLNARMAAGGMGTSGALSALGTDMRSKAAFDAANSIQGVRSDARDEWSRNVQAGLGSMNQDRNLDMNEAKYQAYIDAINGMQPTPEEEAQAKNKEENDAALSDEVGADVTTSGTRKDKKGVIHSNTRFQWWNPSTW